MEVHADIPSYKTFLRDQELDYASLLGLLLFCKYLEKQHMASGKLLASVFKCKLRKLSGIWV